MAVFGLDFGTTNSLVAYVEGDQAVALLDRQERPHPSVVQYHGTECVVGRDAKAQLSKRTAGIVGDIVRSPKRYLGTGQSIPSRDEPSSPPRSSLRSSNTSEGTPDHAG